jgi:YVTN family beta-propeller protein
MLKRIGWTLALVSIAACEAPNRIAPSWPGSYLVVLEKQDAQAAVIEPNSGWVKDRFATDAGPHEVVVSRNGEFAVTSNYGDGGTRGHTLTVIALLERRRESTIDLSPHERPHGIVFLDRRSTVLVTSETSSAVLEVSLRGLKVERTIPTGAQGSHMIALSLDHKRAYTTNVGSGTVSVLDIEKGELVKQIQVGSKPEGLDVASDGRIWVGLNDEARVVVIDPNSLAVTESIADLPLPIRVKVTFDGKLAVVSCAASNEIALIDTKTLQIVARIPMMKLDAGPTGAREGFTPGSSMPIGIVIDPQSKLAFVALNAADKVAVIDLEEHRVRGHFETGHGPDGMAFVFQLSDPRGSLLDGADF